MQYLTRVFLACLFLATTSGCLVRRVPASNSYHGPEAVPERVAAAFAYEVETPGIPAIVLKIQPMPGGVTASELSFRFPETLAGRDAPMQAAWFRTPHLGPDGRAPCVVLLPYLGGSYEPVRAMALLLADEGFHVFLPYREEDIVLPSRTPEAFNGMLIASTIRLRRAIDWISALPEVDPGCIGVMGISMGGIRAVVLAGAEPRLAACVFLMAGGPIADVLAESKEKIIVRYREEVMAEQGMTAEEFRERCRIAMTADPIRMAPYVDARKCLQIITTMDEVVHVRFQDQLHAALGKPESWRVFAGHYSLALYFDWCMNRSVEFFHARFKN